ncbi:MAG: flavin reductase family protein [Kiritimatiellae bacterium]|nr:flavin reductase family protein [Kiritimatiellia bacterium]
MTSKTDLGPVPAVFPMPVLVVAAYDAKGTVQLLNAAWGQICDTDKIALFLDPDHATMKAILAAKAFTVALADRAHMAEADYVGIVSGNQVADKFARSGLHAAKSARVNAPVIDEFPVTMECELAEVVESKTLYAVVGTIVNTLADPRILDDAGKVAPSKLDAIAFDQFRHGYYATGEKAGQAWNAGGALARAAQAAAKGAVQ